MKAMTKKVEELLAEMDAAVEKVDKDKAQKAVASLKKVRGLS